MEGSHKSRIVTLIIVIGFSCSVIFHYVAAAYLGKGYPYSTFLFRPNDHFNDFLSIYRATTRLNPYADSVSVYFPFSYIPIYLLTCLKPLVAFAVFTGLFLAFLLTAEYRLISAEEINDRVSVMFVLTAISYPVLFILDRGNLECLVFIFLGLFIYYHKKEKNTSAAVLLSCAIAMKLYPAVFGVLFIAERKWKPLLLTTAVAFLLTIVSASLFEGGVVASVAGLQNNLHLFKIQYMGTLQGLQHNSSLYVPVTCICTKLSLKPLIALGYPVFAMTIFIVAAAYVIFREKVYWKKTAILACMMILLPQISYDYKLIHLFIPLLLFLGCIRRSRFDFVYSLLFGALLIPKDYYYFLADISINGVLNSLLMVMLIGIIVVDKTQDKSA